MPELKDYNIKFSGIVNAGLVGATTAVFSHNVSNINGNTNVFNSVVNNYHSKNVISNSVIGINNSFNSVNSNIDTNYTPENVVEDVPWYECISNFLATAGTTVFSVVEGVLNFTENIVDLALIVTTAAATLVTGVIDLGQAIHGAATGREWQSATVGMWNNTMATVATDHVTTAFDSFYQNNPIGRWTKENSYYFDQVRAAGKAVGYAIGVTALTIATFGAGGVLSAGATTTSLASSAAAAATPTISQFALVNGLGYFSKGVQTAWSKGSSMQEGLMYGTVTGTWGAIDFVMGKGIGNVAFQGITSHFKKEIMKTAVHYGGQALLYAADGTTDYLVTPLMDLTYVDGVTDRFGNYNEFTPEMNYFDKYMAIYDSYGGSEGLFVASATGATRIIPTGSSNTSIIKKALSENSRKVGIKTVNNIYKDSAKKPDVENVNTENRIDPDYEFVISQFSNPLKQNGFCDDSTMMYIS